MTSIYDLPDPDPAAILRSQALSAEIKKEIIKKGPLSFADFMALALYHPKLGYYNATPQPFGEDGDFITAPTLTPLFAQCFAKQCQQILPLLTMKHIYELGAGSGHFAQDLITELKALGTLPQHYYIYEVSDNLRKAQQHLLSCSHPDYFDRIIWLEDIPLDYTGIVIANEVLDAFPVHCFQVGDDKILERAVTFENDQYRWQNILPQSPLLAEKAENIRITYALPSGYQTEINLNLAPYLNQLFSGLREGIVFFIDYGYGQAEYYHPERKQGTLTSFYKHRQLQNPFLFPGLQDITAHVDFTRVIDEASNYQGQLLGFTTQAAFLLACGLMDLVAKAEQTMLPIEAFKLHQAVKLLTLPTEMGERVKVMAISKNITLALLGFRLQDRRRDL